MAQKDNKPVKRTGGPWKSIVIVGTSFGIGLFVGLSFSKAQLLFTQQEEVQLLNKLQSFQYPRDLSAAQPYCTEQGFQILEATSTSGTFLRNYKSPRLSDVKVNGDICDIEITRDSVEGISMISVRLIKNQSWKFDDIFLKKINGEEWGFWFSDYQKSPGFFTAWTYRNDITSGIQKTADTIEQINRIAKGLNELFGDKSSESTETNTISPSEY